MLKRLALFLDDFEKNLIIVIFTVLLILVFSQVITRYVFSFTFSWAEQMARLMFVWISLIGASLAAKKKQHLRVSFVAVALGEKKGKVLFFIGDLIAAVFCLFLSYKLLELTVNVAAKGQVFTGMPMVPIWIMYLAGFLGLLGMGIRFIQVCLLPALKEWFFSKG
ncbi:MAG TPA: TRAP transporter small permease [Clostridia bacterium]|nr:TRAP transporter small permease [Clostridia bacterium]